MRLSIKAIIGWRWQFKAFQQLSVSLLLEGEGLRQVQLEAARPPLTSWRSSNTIRHRSRANWVFYPLTYP